MIPFSYLPNPESSSFVGETAFVFSQWWQLCNPTRLHLRRMKGTAEQRAARTPDAFRLCADYIPDATKS